MAAVQAEDVRASFLFVGDLNGHHQDWLGFYDHEARTVVELQPFTSQPSPVAISWCRPNPCTLWNT